MRRINAHHNAHPNAHDISLQLKIVVMDCVVIFTVQIYTIFIDNLYYIMVIKFNY